MVHSIHTKFHDLERNTSVDESSSFRAEAIISLPFLKKLENNHSRLHHSHLHRQP